MKTRAAVACEASALLSIDNADLHGLRPSKVPVQSKATCVCGQSMGRDIALARPRPLPA